MKAPPAAGAARRDRAFFCIVGTLLAMAVVIYQGDYSGYAAALAERSAATGTMLHTQGYAGTENVFDPGYRPPVLGHWVRKDDQGNMKWLSARAYIAKYGTDDPTNGTFLGHSETEISKAPSL